MYVLQHRGSCKKFRSLFNYCNAAITINFNGDFMRITGIVFLIILLIGALVGAICWPYTINTWLVFFDKEPAIVWWQGSLMGFVPFLGQASVPAAVITFILMLFL